MAGSGSRPLTNIPYCCLPYESGPCLSTSVGVTPLRAPRHHCLGRPLPYQLANATRAHPCPISIWIPFDAEGYRHAVLIRLSTGYPPDMGRLLTRYAPVRHSHHFRASSEKDPVRLACIRPAASV